ncbi:MAG: 3D domain-containing protein, partial [Lachnospiraceae bacterium]|nr:3D domain-containing protein [Lachnospiraceae bacterium]
GGSSEIVDDRIVALAKVSDEREKEMEKKYGPRIEDNIISSPSDYKDGDRVVATANTRTETAGAYVSSGSWDKTEAGEGGSGIVKLFGSIYSGLAGGKRVSEDRDGSDSGSFSVSGFFTNIRDRVMSFVYSEEDMISLGTFSLTAYDACIECCGKTDGITATGTRAKAGRTIAVDPNVIPYGSRVMINGEVYIAEDTGSAIKGSRIDIYMNTHEEAKRFGRKSAEVYLLK